MAVEKHKAYYSGWIAEMVGNLKPAQHYHVGQDSVLPAVMAGFVKTIHLNRRDLESKHLEGLITHDSDGKSISAGNSLSLVVDDGDNSNDEIQLASRLLKAGGNLFVIASVGRNLPAARILNQFKEFELREFSLIPDRVDQVGFIRHAPLEWGGLQEDGTGCFWLRKKFPEALNQEAYAVAPLYPGSFSQVYEDRIIEQVLKQMDISNPSYLDVGAHHPIVLSNTFLFYQQGGRGVLVEPNPILHTQLERTRPKDICLNVGVGATTQGDMDFFVMDWDVLSTFSQKTVEEYCSFGNRKVMQVMKIPLVSINDIMAQHFPSPPSILSLDVEGYDMDILRSLDFNKHRPVVICVETLSYTENNTERKTESLIEFVKSNGYMVYADTYINTIFVDKSKWDSRSQKSKSNKKSDV